MIYSNTTKSDEMDKTHFILIPDATFRKLEIHILPSKIVEELVVSEKSNKVFFFFVCFFFFFYGDRKVEGEHFGYCVNVKVRI